MHTSSRAQTRHATPARHANSTAMADEGERTGVALPAAACANCDRALTGGVRADEVEKQLPLDAAQAVGSTRTQGQSKKPKRAIHRQDNRPPWVRLCMFTGSQGTVDNKCRGLCFASAQCEALRSIENAQVEQLVFEPMVRCACDKFECLACLAAVAQGVQAEALAKKNTHEMSVSEGEA